MQNKYSEDVIAQAINLSRQGLSSREIATVLGIGSKSTINNWLADDELIESIRAEKPVVAGEALSRHAEPRKLEGNRFFITSIQNNTRVHGKFWDVLTKAAQELGAEIFAIPFSYNANAFSNGSKHDDDLWYDPRVKPYLLSERAKITDNLVVHGELNISPTAVNPLAGLHGYAMGNSVIVPHTKQMLKSMPVHPELEPRIAYTTGTCTLLNYKQQKVGQIAEFHHVFGALFVELDSEGRAYVRQINAETDTGNFYDLNIYYTDKGGRRVEGVFAVNLPDLHLENAPEDLLNATRNMVEDLSPCELYLHDTIDFAVRNHHNINNHIWRFTNYHHGEESVRASMELASYTLSAISEVAERTYVVRSNHDLAIEKYLDSADYRVDYENACYFLELQSYRYNYIRDNKTAPNMLEHIYRSFERFREDVQFLPEDANHMRLGIQFGSHGHNGNSGSRGSTQSFKQTGLKVNKGHSHAPEIDGGVYSAGVLSHKAFDYCKGYTKWACSSIVTYPNGKRCIVTMNSDLKYRA